MPNMALPRDKIIAMHVAIQGEVGSFHHQVAREWFGETAEIIDAESFGEVFGILNRREAPYAVVAIENSLYGSINEVYDLVEAHGYPIIGEVYLRIEQQLIGLPGSTLTDINTIYSHPVALAQCEQSLNTHAPDARHIEYHDTAAAVRFIKDEQNPQSAAIASRLAAELYNLPILASNIEDHHANYTRFFILSATMLPIKNPNKTSLVFETDHSPGSLAKVLTIFADAGINLSKLVSRPIIGKVWHYRFYADIETAGPTLVPLIDAIKQYCKHVTILGEYARDQLDR
jgi:prephenate dehydratase